jgi:hypothetical protein
MLMTLSVAPMLVTSVFPTFDELAVRAEVILQGSVADTQSKWTG